MVQPGYIKITHLLSEQKYLERKINLLRKRLRKIKRQIKGYDNGNN